jgi:phenylpropionate dioxygenase-like ring-hydroxylating dioxygenase large terminal subunit
MTTAAQLGLGDGSAPNEQYVSPAQFEAEREHVFRRVWLVMGRVEEVAKPGDFIVRDAPPLNASVVIVRGADDVVRAFHNTCSHRGVALVCQEHGSADSFRCPYHAWTYGIDGALNAIPSQVDFPHVDPAKNGLTPISLDIWNGFIFLNFDPAPKVGLREFLGGLDELYDGMPFEDYPFYIRVKDEVEANWKILMNAFGEGYHVPILHRKTLFSQVVTRDNPYLHYFDIKTFGPHSTGTVQRNFDWQPSTPVLKFVLDQMLPTSVPDKEAIAAGRGITAHKGLNRIKLPNFGTENIILFPNFLLQPLANGYLFFQFWPISYDRMSAEVRIYGAHPPRSLREEFAAAATLAATRDVLAEDMAMARLQQKGLNGRGKPRQYFGENEPLLRFFQEQLDNYLAEGAASRAEGES